MTILQAGVAKSGNYWLYRIIELGLARAGVERRSVIERHPIQADAASWTLSFQGQASIDVLDVDRRGASMRIGSAFREPITDLPRYVDECTHVWTHSPMSPRMEAALPLFERAVYVLRDPRDVLVSMSHFVGTDYMREHYPTPDDEPAGYRRRAARHHHRLWTHHVAGWLAVAERHDIHVVPYERLRTDFAVQCTRLLAYLGLPHDEADVAAIAEAVDLRKQRRDNPDHVRRGAVAGWVDELGSEGQVSSRDTLRLLEALRYPTGSEAPVRLPSVTDLDAAELARIAWRTRPSPVAKAHELATSLLPGRR